MPRKKIKMKKKSLIYERFLRQKKLAEILKPEELKKIRKKIKWYRVDNRVLFLLSEVKYYMERIENEETQTARPS